MQMTIHCPVLYERAEGDARIRGMIIQLLMRTIEHPWILPMDGRLQDAVVASIKRWPDQADQERARSLLKRLNDSNHFVKVVMPENPRDPWKRAHQIARRDSAYWLVDLQEHETRGDFGADSSSAKWLDDLLLMGLESPWETGKVLPPRGTNNKRWSRAEFSSLVWQPIFRWTHNLSIYDRNIVKYWPQRNYLDNLQWILEEFAEWQPGGEVTIPFVNNAKQSSKDIVKRWCCNQAERLGIGIKTSGTIDGYFHDRYFQTQQGWWRSHRGVDLCSSGQLLRADVELTWQAYAPPGLKGATKKRPR